MAGDGGVGAELGGLALGVDHVGVAVIDLEAAAVRFEAALGVRPVHRERVESQGVEEVLFPLGPSFLQLLGALGPETPVGRFLDRRGEGIHHVALRVRDVSASLDRLRAAAFPLIDETPRAGSRGTSIAFLSPKGLDGVLIELVELPE